METMGKLGGISHQEIEKLAAPATNGNHSPPTPPPLPTLTTSYEQIQRPLIRTGSTLRVPRRDNKTLIRVNPAAAKTQEVWDKVFDEAYKTDVAVYTDKGKIYAHANILGMASPVMKSQLKRRKKQKKSKNGRRSVYIRGVPHDAVRAFVRYLYSSCYSPEDMEAFAIHLLVLSHAFAVPHLKRECEQKLEEDVLDVENVIDVFQLALLCDAPRLSLFCHRMIVGQLKAVSLTEGWNVMLRAHPVLEKQILKSVAEAEAKKEAMNRKKEERKMYEQLYEAMEALVHICRDGCRTIGPHNVEPPKEDQGPCPFPACRGLELLVRHFAGCKLRVPGGCAQCKRMWRLLELHSYLCADSDACRVPLCNNFKERSGKVQNKKEEMKWKLLAKKIVSSKTISGAPYFSLVAPSL